MNMLSFLSKHPDLVQSVAAEAGTKPVYLRQIAYGHRKPSHGLSKAIERASAGAVTVHDLRPDIFGPAPAERDAAS